MPMLDLTPISIIADFETCDIATELDAKSPVEKLPDAMEDVGIQGKLRLGIDGAIALNVEVCTGKR